MPNLDTPELVFLPLGGCGEIGMNLNAYGYGPAHDRKWILVDLGVTFGDDSTPGIDLICADPEFLEDQADNIEADIDVQPVAKPRVRWAVAYD